MSTNAPGSCCYRGVQHEGKAVGRYEKVDDFEVYISEAPDKSTEKGILILTDATGHRFNNAQLIADSFAQNGYFVFVPDLFYEDPVKMNESGDFDIMKWVHGEYNEKKIAHTPPVVDPIVETSIKEMQTRYGVKKVGAVGYCFGAKYLFRFLKPGQIDVGYSGPLSFVDDKELEAIKGPYAISLAETDHLFTTEQRHHSEEILKKTGQPYQINLYSGVEHNFAVRGDPNNRVVQFAKESAFLQALQWFEEHLVTNTPSKL